MNAYSAWSKLFCWAFVAAMLSMGSAEAIAESQYLIVASEPPTETLEVGKVLAVGDTLNVPTGTVVTLLGENGSVNKLVGPVVVAVTADIGKADSADEIAKKRSTLSKIGELLVGEQKSADTLGVSRSANAQVEKAEIDPWAIPLTAPVGCVLDRKIRLVRNNTDRDVVLSIGFNNKEQITGLLWEGGEAFFDYQGEVPAATATLAVTTDSTLVNIALVFAPQNLDARDKFKVIQFFSENGCASQLVSFFKQVK